MITMRVHRPGAAGPSFPFSLGTVMQWTDPSDVTTQWKDSARSVPAANGDLLYYLDDKSGNARHNVQTTSGARGTRADASINGLTCLSVGAACFMKSSFTVPSDVTIFIVGKTASTSFNAYILDGFSANNTLGMLFDSATDFISYASGTYSPGIAATTTGSAHIYTAVFSSTTGLALFGVDATEVSANIGSAASAGGVTLGCSGLNTTPSYGGVSGPGKIGESIIYSGILSSANRISARATLKAKWGTP